MDTFESGQRSKLSAQNSVERDIWETTFRVRGISGVRVTRWGPEWFRVTRGENEILKDFVSFESACTWLESFGFRLDLAWFHR